jgi:cytochrome c-type biogenesis protein CcmH/NrfF
VLLVPRAEGFDALVWILPVLAFVCAIAGLVVAFRRWQRADDIAPTADDRALVAAARFDGSDKEHPA